ncbi:MAG: hda [Hydrocarboniphaga sp.]|uniref:DnaA regulatory inactivator Hda n=1 Tax=Hydrocarboniphaga sp. TaxID=2033016 RepID=UPI002612EA2B|nr:DnaA regulatory inactivator Hda [Hydrocarboniphaga sp.]MDB5969641.1 hda [Hydrocarboniphaga sp.]
MKGEQIPLAVQLRSTASFNTYHAGPNREAVDALRALSVGGLYLYGSAGTGKTHLLQAAAREAQQRGLRVSYLPLRSLVAGGAEALDGLTAFDRLCIDDLDAIDGDIHWNHAVIRLLDRLRTEGSAWCVSAAAGPDRLARLLPDLRTRLSALPLFGLRTLGDDDRRLWLRSAAQQRGLELPDDAARWLIHHLPRDTGSLIAAIEKLDRASLRDKRRLTLVFVQKTLSLLS